jgi:8-oxo-dGTP diphosphatase
MIAVSCAIIVNDENKILVTQRGASMKLPLKWEFPGGKVEANESPENCLIREIKEELDIDINIKSSLEPVEHHYKEFSIRLIPFVCKINSGKIKLSEHADYRWLNKNELLDLDWAEADVFVLKNFPFKFYL